MTRTEQNLFYMYVHHVHHLKTTCTYIIPYMIQLRE